MKSKIIRLSGPVVVASNMGDAKMFDVVRVGNEKLLGEVIRLEEKNAVIQVYEDTAGLKPGEPVENTGRPLSIELGPGLLENMFDGIGRPLVDLAKMSGDFINRGLIAPSLPRDKKWDFKPTVENGDKVTPGQIIGTVQESKLITHKILVPPHVSGKVKGIKAGKYLVTDNICTIGKEKVQLFHYSPVRNPRAFAKKLKPENLLFTGRRVMDTFFPLVKGGSAAVPGPFGAGKTVTQHALAKFCEADIIIYIGCGERGNEMTEVLNEFPKLIDPKTNRPIMERTVMIANTSNMPVAAREASIYTGITIAEYFRDQGYDVALMADSTSRWAEAMREISSRLEEMPGEEGYPAYLGSKLAQFYERAGVVNTLGGEEGSVSIIGAVSPPGGDFSEPVTQNTLRVTKVFWGLDANLAAKRHFPTINWLTSYSLYSTGLDNFFAKKLGSEFNDLRHRAMKLLQKEAELQEIIQLVGPDSLPENEKAIVYSTRQLREDYLQQDSFDKIDMNCSLEKQYAMLKTIMNIHDKIIEAIPNGLNVSELYKLKTTALVGRLKFESDFKTAINKIESLFKKELKSLESQND